MKTTPRVTTVTKLEGVTLELSSREAYILMKLIGSNSALTTAQATNTIIDKREMNIPIELRANCGSDEAGNFNSLYDNLRLILSEK